MTEEELRSYAAVVLEVGLGFVSGKDLAINAMNEHAPFARLLCDEAYRRGAAYVDLWYWDPHTKAARLRHAAPDPVRARHSRMQTLQVRCAQLNERRFAALHFLGPGTDLTIGLLTRHRWDTAALVSQAGIHHVAALPTEEIFTTPDPTRTE